MPMLPPPGMNPTLQGTSPMQSVSPENFLMAAADMHQKGEFQNMPQAKGPELQEGSKRKPKHNLRVLR